MQTNEFIGKTTTTNKVKTMIKAAIASAAAASIRSEEGEKQHGQAREPGGVSWMRCNASRVVKFEIDQRSHRPRGSRGLTKPSDRNVKSKVDF